LCGLSEIDTLQVFAKDSALRERSAGLGMSLASGNWLRESGSD
jgi:hypothetical protein